MRMKWKKGLLIGGLALMTAAMAGCYGGYGYGSYSSYNQVPKTTAAKETLEEFDLSILRTDEGVFQYHNLEWGSKSDVVGEYLGVSLDSAVTFSDGSGYCDVNYSILVEDMVSVGVMPTFDTDGGLCCISFYFENVYTAEQLDAFYERLTAACEKEFGEADEIREQVDESNGVEYSSVTAMWYHEISETSMTSLQIGKLDSGKGTEAVVFGVNHYDPTELEEETTEEGTSEE